MPHARHWATTAAAWAGFALPSLSLAATLNVPGDFATIQACIDAAVSGVDECVVAPGTYHETINFFGKAITVRSSGGRDVTTIDATGIGGSAVSCISNEGPDSVLDGFTITGGSGTTIDPGYTFGGGMYNNPGAPTVTDCTFSGNTAFFGAGMYNKAGAPTVTDCTFSGNTATYGGGMYNNAGAPTVTNCTFSGNAADRGGGIYNSASGVAGDSATVARCTFRENTAHDDGGGIYNFFGRPKLSNSTFNGNKADNGGGVYNFSSGAAVTNCAFRGNTGSFHGGGIVNDGTYMTRTTVTKSTFTGNRGAGGAMYNFFYSDPKLVGCIFWGNSPSEILNADAAAPSVLFSDVQGGLPIGAIDGGGNIDLDPMFVRSPDPGPDGTWDGVDDDYGDLRLQAGSPCIDTDDPAFVAQPGETDLEGHARVLCGRVDMGAYEFGIGDYDCDQTVDLTDFANWTACMTGPKSGPYDVGCEAFDFDADGDVDILDFAAFQRIIEP